jgi:general stress protein 26
MNRDQLLSTTRLGILITHRSRGAQMGVPMGVPVWFQWDGELLRCFASKTSAKIKRLQSDPRASLLVTNVVGETEGWVAFDGTIEIHDKGGIELAETLAARYWNLDDPEKRAALDGWKQVPDAFVLLTMRPGRIREGR